MNEEFFYPSLPIGISMSMSIYFCGFAVINWNYFVICVEIHRHRRISGQRQAQQNKYDKAVGGEGGYGAKD